MSEENETLPGKDLLENFQTWPHDVQASFLDMLARVTALQSEPEVIRWRNLLGEYHASVRVNQLKTKAFMKELVRNPDAEHFIKKSTDRQYIKELMNEVRADQNIILALLDIFSDEENADGDDIVSE
ncbi:MAG TPA: hypothetical protein VJZ27_09120 [Aggregatilineales bacterium]|nr:hypothetical protein [Aggregatilineales bacterium]